jgi:ABC-type glycerol-3-phosphate transport system permease component
MRAGSVTLARAGKAVSVQYVVLRVLLYTALAVGTFIFIWPLLWLIASSVKPTHEVYRFPPNLIPSEIQWSHYPDALENFNFARGFGNTMTVVVGVLFGRLLSCTMVAFAFARIRVPFRDGIFMVVLATMMLPYHVTLIPQFLLFRDLGWLDSFLPLIVPSFFATSAYIIFLLRQFFMAIPTEYDEAAEIDGCGYFGIYWRIILPQAMPALGVVAILTFMGEWNDFLAPLIYLNDQATMTLAVGLRAWQLSLGQPGAGYLPVTWPLVVSTVLTIIPLAVFFFTQRYFIQGVVVSGIKG